ncbi:MAG: adenosine deaminase [Acidobacteriaceae bacterium]|jgi:adenosine deaminase
MTRIRRTTARALVAVIAAAGITLPAAVLISCTGPSQTNAQFRQHVPTANETRAENHLNAAKHYGMPELYAFLKPFPKGADLHMHLSGAVYAETFIAEAIKQGLCVTPVDTGKPASPIGQDAVKFVAPVGGSRCGAGAVPASTALTNQGLYDNLIDSFSMRAFVPIEGINGHDQFFSTFARFGGLKDVAGEWLDEVAARAAAQNEQYLEIMQTPPFSNAAKLGNQIGWPAGSENSVTPQTLAGLRDKLLAAGLRSEVAVDEKDLGDAQATRESMEHCNGGGVASPACGVRIHFLYQVLRGFAPQQVFAQTLLGFEVATADPDVVGINFVMPEDGEISMRDYHLQMQMLDYLHSVYPKVHISLHAGELAPGLVPPEGLRFHIREAVELGHAERIGHGVDVLYEDHPFDLLKEMAARHVDVEINLTSNDGILGVKGSDHPLAAYMAAHVPFSLSTDDEGVSRIDLTHEYARAVDEQDLSYVDLKHSARDSLEHSFLPGESLWAQLDDYDHPKAACAATVTANSKPTDGCRQLLNANEKAAQQWELERRIAAFEASLR